MTSKVYWIHTPEEKDILSQGYVGYTSRSIEDRLFEHKWIKPHHIVETVFEGTEQDCLDREHMLRPKENIGYNICVGGGIPPKSKKGRTLSEETKRKMSESHKRRWDRIGRKPPREKLSKEERSKWARENAYNRIRNGNHNFSSEFAKQHNKRLMEEGTHIFLTNNPRKKK